MWLLLQVWLELSWLWQAAENNCGYVSRPPPLPDPHSLWPKLTKSQKHHWRQFVLWCNLVIAPASFFLAVKLCHLPSRHVSLQYLGLLVGGWIGCRFYTSLSNSIGTYLDRVSNKQIGYELEMHTNHRGRSYLREKRFHQLPSVSSLVLQALFHMWWLVVVCLSWFPNIVMVYWVGMSPCLISAQL